MRTSRRLAGMAVAVLFSAVAAVAVYGPAQSQTPPDVPIPHGNYGATTHRCESCHTLHDAPGSTALMGKANEREVCYTCHDGSTTATDVKSQFGTETSPQNSSHPVPSGALLCSDCHTGHLSPADDTALLRVMIGGTYVYSPPDTPIGNGFCYACHGPGSTLPAPKGDHSFFETSVHNTSDGVAMPASGSQIKCLACHEPHGSSQTALTLSTKPQEDLCYTCHTQATPNTSGGSAAAWGGTAYPGSNVVNAFATPNDTTTADGNGVRIYHHPIGTAEQFGSTRRVECASCHAPHLANADDTATTSKIADPTKVRGSDATWIPNWDTTSGYLNRASNVTGYCTTCHVSPTTTAPVNAGPLVPFDVRLINDTALDADGRPHDKFVASTWTSSRHGDPLLNPSKLSYKGCADRGLTGSQCVVTCTACHDFHGTSNAYMLRETVDAPDTTATSTMTGFTALDTAADRLKLQTFCLTCHPERGTGHNSNKLCTQCHYHGSGKL